MQDLNNKPNIAACGLVVAILLITLGCDSGLERSVTDKEVSMKINASPNNPKSDSQELEIMTLETQIEKLASLGLSLNEGVSIDDLLNSFGRDAFEDKPYDLLLFAYGIEVESEPWGRNVCDQVWNFDNECIYQTGDYVKIVKRLALVADCTDRITEIEDFVDIADEEAWLKFNIDGQPKKYTIEVMGDWVDRMTIAYVLDSIQQNGKRFYFKDNGQAMVLFYLDESAYEELNRLSSNALAPVNDF